MCLRLPSCHQSANSLRGGSPGLPSCCHKCRSQMRQARIPSGQNLTLTSQPVSAPDDLSQNHAVRCRVYRRRGPQGRYSFHSLEQKWLLGLPAPVSHFSPPLDDASLPSLVTRPPPCSGSRANFITSLLTASARDLGGLQSRLTLTFRKHPPPEKKAHSFVIACLSH